MCNFYGDVGLLPKTKRSGVQTGVDTLWARIPLEGSPLEALGATYTRQHEVLARPLDGLCIHAELVAELGHRGEPCQFRFFDPAMWASLLGAVHVIALPKAIDVAFDFLGNAIHVVHAAMVLLNAFCGVGLVSRDCKFHETLMAIWGARLTSHKAVLIETEHEYLVVDHGQFVDSLCLSHLRAPFFRDEQACILTLVLPQQKSVDFVVVPDVPVKHVLSLLSFPDHLLEYWGLLCCASRRLFTVDESLPATAVVLCLAFVPKSLRKALHHDVVGSESPTANEDSGSEDEYWVKDACLENGVSPNLTWIAAEPSVAFCGVDVGICNPCNIDNMEGHPITIDLEEGDCHDTETFIADESPSECKSTCLELVSLDLHSHTPWLDHPCSLEFCRISPKLD